MKRNTPRHPKMLRLADELGIPLPYAVGIMEMLWQFTADFAPAGDIGKFDDTRIAAAVGWPKKPAVLIAALIECRWVDVDHLDETLTGLDETLTRKLVVHDWSEHADRGVCQKLKNAGQSFYKVSGKTGAPVGTKSVPTAVIDKDRVNGSISNTEIKTVSRARNGTPNTASVNTDAVNAVSTEHDDFGMFLEVCEIAQMLGSEPDRDKAREEWKALDLSEKLAACKGIRDRVASGEFADPAFRPFPQNYLKNKIWDRPIRQRREIGVDKIHAERVESVELTKAFRAAGRPS